MRLHALVAMVVLTACGGVPVVDVGTGFDLFIPIRDGDMVPLIHGPQGGYHVWGAVRAENVDRSELKLRYSLALEQDPRELSVRTDTVDLGAGGEHTGTA